MLHEDGEKFRTNLAVTQKRLFATATELVKQTSVTIEQNGIITDLNQQMQTLDESLKTAFKNIQKLQSNLNTQKKSDLNNSRASPLFETSSRGDVDMKLLEFLARNPIPLKFLPRGNDVYTFGSRKVKLETVNDRLTVRVNGGNMLLEEFIRLYAHQELLKMKITNLSQNLIDMEEENIPPDTRDDQVIWNGKDKDHYFSAIVSRKKPRADTSYQSHNNSKVHKLGETTNLTLQDEQSSRDFNILDITPQTSKEEITQENRSRGLLRSPYDDKKLDPTRVFASSLRNYESESRQKTSTRSHDPYKANTSSKLSYKR